MPSPRPGHSTTHLITSIEQKKNKTYRPQFLVHNLKSPVINLGLCFLDSFTSCHILLKKGTCHRWSFPQFACPTRHTNLFLFFIMQISLVWDDIQGGGDRGGRWRRRRRKEGDGGEEGERQEEECCRMGEKRRWMV